MNSQNKKTTYSVVIPVLNEEENVVILYERIASAVNTMGEPYEVIFVDDGSTDATYAKLRQLKSQDNHLKLIKFRRNFGQSAAIGAGFRYASGDIIIAMDGDLQNDPNDIPNLVAKLEEGYDIVSGWRKNRQDKLIIRKVPSKIANGFIRYLTRVPINDTGCSLKAYRKEIVKKITVYGELHRFIPTLARIEGAKIGEIVVSHHPRKFGSSKYNITRTFKVLMDLTTLNLFLKYLTNPTRFFGSLGLLFNFFGTLALFSMIYCLVVLKFNFAEINVLLSTAFLLITAGLQLLFFGLLANMVVKTSDRTNAKLYDKYPS